MNAGIRHVPLDRLMPHPDSPNRMSRASFEKLVRNIERCGRYEPVVVRPCPNRKGFFQVINGRHRCDALRKLGYESVDVVVWNVDDEQTNLLLATLNRLSGRDTLEKKVGLLKRLSRRIPIRKLARLVPQTLGQIERLTTVKPRSEPSPQGTADFVTPLVFFVHDGQQRTIEEALRVAGRSSEETTRAGRRATALAQLAVRFLALEDSDGCFSAES